jgi:HK97 family phage major capsid protein
MGGLEGADARDFMPEEEYRVLSKGASGGGFLVPTDVSEMIIAAARAASAVAQVATEVVTDRGETVGMALAGTHGSAAWTAESGSYTPSDETITQQNLGAFKAASKIIVSEELRADELVDLDAISGVRARRLRVVPVWSRAAAMAANPHGCAVSGVVPRLAP